MVSGEPKTASSDRRSWPVRVYRLGAEPGDDLSATTSVEARLAMMWPLSLDAWTLAGRTLPSYSRRETPLSRRPFSPSTSTSRPR
jgi:hypothetical protein